MRVSVFTSCAVVLSILAAPAVCQAAPLELGIEHYPLVFNSYIDVQYLAYGAMDGQYGLFTATGWSIEVNYGGDSTVDLYEGDFVLTAVIDRDTGAAISGSLLITGDLDGANVVTLFESDNLVALGFCAEDMFEFLFTQKGATDLGVTDGDAIGVVLDGRQIANFSEPSFTQSFSGDGFANANAFYLPEPASICIICAIGGVMLRRRGRRG